MWRCMHLSNLQIDCSWAVPPTHTSPGFETKTIKYETYTYDMVICMCQRAQEDLLIVRWYIQLRVSCPSGLWGPLGPPTSNKYIDQKRTTSKMFDTYKVLWLYFKFGILVSAINGRNWLNWGPVIDQNQAKHMLKNKIDTAHGITKLFNPRYIIFTSTLSTTNFSQIAFYSI